MTGNNGKRDCPRVVEMIGGTWDRQFAQYASQTDGPLKGAGGYTHMCTSVYLKALVHRLFFHSFALMHCAAALLEYKTIT